MRGLESKVFSSLGQKPVFRIRQGIRMRFLGRKEREKYSYGKIQEANDSSEGIIHTLFHN